MENLNLIKLLSGITKQVIKTGEAITTIIPINDKELAESWLSHHAPTFVSTSSEKETVIEIGKDFLSPVS
jgi:hypothetical protein